MSQPAENSNPLDGGKPIKANPIQITRSKNSARQARNHEISEILLGALAAVAERAGVKLKTIGGLTVISLENVTTGEDEAGNTTLHFLDVEVPQLVERVE